MRCMGNRKMCIDLFFVVLIILAFSIVVSHLHASPLFRPAPVAIVESFGDTSDKKNVGANKPEADHDAEKSMLNVKRGAQREAFQDY